MDGDFFKKWMWAILLLQAVFGVVVLVLIGFAIWALARYVGVV